MTASQCSISASEAGLRDWRIGDGSSTMDLSSWRRRLVEGGVGEREVAMSRAMLLKVDAKKKCTRWMGEWRGRKEEGAMIGRRWTSATLFLWSRVKRDFISYRSPTLQPLLHRTTSSTSLRTDIVLTDRNIRLLSSYICASAHGLSQVPLLYFHLISQSPTTSFVALSQSERPASSMTQL